MTTEKQTEKDSLYDALEEMKVAELLGNINNEDSTIAGVLHAAIPQIENLVNAILEKMQTGGRLFYIGAGTSGRLGVLDAAECPPTFGVPPSLVIGVIAGGIKALWRAVEFSEDDTKQGWKDLKKHRISDRDFLIGISAGGTTPYVIAALQKARKKGILCGCITCNSDSPLAELAQFPVETVTGPEFVTGSTRMKAGTATKLALNMISTAVMVRLGHVRGNRMIDLLLNSEKLFDRGVRIIMKETGSGRKEAVKALKQKRSVREAVEEISRKAPLS